MEPSTPLMTDVLVYFAYLHSIMSNGNISWENLTKKKKPDCKEEYI
jgi:hypothetical protein